MANNNNMPNPNHPTLNTGNVPMHELVDLHPQPVQMPPILNLGSLAQTVNSLAHAMHNLQQMFGMFMERSIENMDRPPNRPIP